MNFLTVLMICAASLELCHAARYKINGTASPPQGHGQENGFSEVEILYEDGNYIPRNDVNTLSARNSKEPSYDSEDSSEEYFDFSDYILKDDSVKDSDDDSDDSDDDSDDSDDDSDYSDDNK
jgi:hypothetical protein